MISKPAQALTTINTHKVGYAGLTVGVGSIVAAAGVLSKVISSPAWWLEMASEIHSKTFGTAKAQLCGALGGLALAILIALFLSYFGRPKNIAE